MAFHNVEGVEIRPPSGDKTYIISDYFTIFNDDNVSPTIYSWFDITGVYENISRFEIYLKGEDKIVLQKEWFDSIDDILSSRTIMEAQSVGNFKYRHWLRLLPDKTSYISTDLPENTLIYNSKYNYQELLHANIALGSQRIIKHLWLYTFILSIITFFFLKRNQKNLLDDIWADAIISVVVALAIAITICLIYYLIDKSIIGRIKRNDEALDVSICFIISSIGIAAIEESVNTFSDIIPWSEINSYSITETMIVFTINNRQKLWLPISGVTSDTFDGIINVIDALNVPEK